MLDNSMLDIEIKIINHCLKKNYNKADVFLENNVLVEKETGIRTELADEVFEEIAKAKRREHLRIFSHYC